MTRTKIELVGWIVFKWSLSYISRLYDVILVYRKQILLTYCCHITFLQPLFQGRSLKCLGSELKGFLQRFLSWLEVGNSIRMLRLKMYAMCTSQWRVYFWCLWQTSKVIFLKILIHSGFSLKSYPFWHKLFNFLIIHSVYPKS